MGAEGFSRDRKGFGATETIALSWWQAIDAAASATHSAHPPRYLRDWSKQRRRSGMTVSLRFGTDTCVLTCVGFVIRSILLRLVIR